MEFLTKQPSAKGPAQMFTGDVWFDVIAKGAEPSRLRVNLVRFAPRARTAWHRHGASADHFMCHLAMWEAPEDPRTPETEWGEHITDDEYAGR